MNKQQFFGKLQELVKEEEVPRLNWISLLSMTTDPDLARFVGQFKLKGAEVQFIKPPIHFVYLGRYYRVDRRVDGITMRVTNIFTSLKDAMDLSGKPYVKQEGDILNVLVFGVMVLPQGFIEFVYPLKRSSLVEWIQFTKKVSAEGKKLTEGFVKVEVSKRAVELGTILVPKFSLVDSVDFEVDYELLLKTSLAYKEHVNRYVEYVNNRITPNEVEDTETVSSEGDDIPF